MFHLASSKIVKKADIREMIMGKWTWSAEGQEDAQIEIKAGGHCAIWKADQTLHPAEYCVWNMVEG
jgi:hypothetical protein